MTKFVVYKFIVIVKLEE